jgi:predicted permease
MVNALLQMMMILLCGAVLVWFKPGDLEIKIIRRGITTLVYYMLLPALVLSVMWRADVGLDSLRIAITSLSGVLVFMLLSWIFTRIARMPATVAGATILATTFCNTVYLGLPVLEAGFGSWARSVAIQYDLLASTPLVLSVGVMIAQHYGHGGDPSFSPFKALLKIPPLWAMVLALVLNVSGVEPPVLLEGFLDLLGGCVIPLMLLSLGMSLRWKNGMRGHRSWLAVIIILQLVLYPIVTFSVATVSGLSGQLLAATAMEGAMPCMVLGIVLCDRYHLDTAFYAAAVTLSTLLSVVTLPIWLHLFTL